MNGSVDFISSDGRAENNNNNNVICAETRCVVGPSSGTVVHCRAAGGVFIVIRDEHRMCVLMIKIVRLKTYSKPDDKGSS